jgi:hypothetical protein
MCGHDLRANKAVHNALSYMNSSAPSKPQTTTAKENSKARVAVGEQSRMGLRRLRCALLLIYNTSVLFSAIVTDWLPTFRAENRVLLTACRGSAV